MTNYNYKKHLSPLNIKSEILKKPLLHKFSKENLRRLSLINNNKNCFKVKSGEEVLEKTEKLSVSKILLNFSETDIKSFEKVSFQEKEFILTKVQSLIEKNKSNSSHKIGNFKLNFCVLDLEITKTQLLLGFYFQDTSTYMAVYLDSTSSNDKIEMVKLIVSQLLKSFSTNDFASEGVLNILLTFNGDSFDLRVLNFLLSPEFSFPAVFDYVQCLISDSPWEKKFGENTDWKFLSNVFTMSNLKNQRFFKFDIGF